MKLTLPRGATGFYNDRNEWVCTGSAMGRANIVPSHPNDPIKLQMERLRLIDGDYDRWGAYWGSGMGRTSIYCAFNTQGNVFDYFNALVFVRAANRDEAKAKVREVLPQARFYR